MASKALSRLMSIHNPMHKPPTYAEMGQTKPRKKGRYDNTPLPVHFILCAKCKNPGGTLVKINSEYFHTDCLGERK